MNKTKYRPFRTTESGDFAECYKEKCMAYYKKGHTERSPSGEYMTLYEDACKKLANGETQVLMQV